ncbi:hypothetical protein PINS_up003060 [Pythium insidiosum]|nr:hypothetical protein PINS_up003060 [Pythium insidiosum]
MSDTYYQSVPLRQPVEFDDDGTFHVEFDRQGGYRFLSLTPTAILPCLWPLFSLCARKHIESQRCHVTDRRVVFESGWLDHSNKNIPLDRIQDVNVRQDCVQQCFGVKTLEIQTAGMGGGLEPEARLIAPANAMMVRDVIMERRDALVLGHPGAMESSVKPTSKSNRNGANGSSYHSVGRLQLEANEAMVRELQTIRDTLMRLESHVFEGQRQQDATQTKALTEVEGHKSL